jgi:hypothetical protein
MAVTMDALAKLIADGEQRRAADMQELRLALTTIKPEIASIRDVVDTFKPELDEIRTAFDNWRPDMENKVGDLGTAVRDLRRQVDHIAKGVGAGALGPAPTTIPPLTGVPPSGAPQLGAHSGQSGHDVQASHRGVAAEQSDALPPTPGTGQHTSLTMVPFAPSSTTLADIAIPQPAVPPSNPPPQAVFPKFDGDNPRLWCRACEKYFRVYAVSEEFWVEYATLHFIGNAALWFQSAEIKWGRSLGFSYVTRSINDLIGVSTNNCIANLSVSVKPVLSRSMSSVLILSCIICWLTNLTLIPPSSPLVLSMVFAKICVLLF